MLMRSWGGSHDPCARQRLPDLSRPARPLALLSSRHRTAIDLREAPIGSPEFLAECARIAALKAVSAKPRPGTLGMLIGAYRASTAFQDLAPRTQRDYQ